MGRLRRPRESAVAYASGLMVAAVLIAAGSGVALWFRSHLGAPPPIVVVAGTAPVTTTSIVPGTRAVTTTPKPVAPPEAIPPQLPDAAAYTAAPSSALPNFVNRSADHYGWYSGDGVSARCDEWTRATAVGSTADMLFVVCGSLFKAFELATGTPIRLGVVARSSGWSGSGPGISIDLTQSVLTIVRDGGNPAVQPMVEWWMP